MRTPILRSLRRKVRILVHKLRAKKIGAISVEPVIGLLLFKTLGQFLGPLTVRKFDHDKMVDHSGLIPLCLLGYLGLYGCASHTSSFWMAAASITAAHLLSNIVYILAFYASLKDAKG